MYFFTMRCDLLCHLYDLFPFIRRRSSSAEQLRFLAPIRLSLTHENWVEFLLIPHAKIMIAVFTMIYICIEQSLQFEGSNTSTGLWLQLQLTWQFMNLFEILRDGTIRLSNAIINSLCRVANRQGDHRQTTSGNADDIDRSICLLLCT